MTADWARPLVHWEIQARDPEKVRAFYSAMFNWEVTPAGPILNIPVGVGGPEPGPAGHILASDTPRVVLYFQVRDLQASVDRAVELGGRTTRPLFQVPGGPTIAGIADPEGNEVMLVQQ